MPESKNYHGTYAYKTDIGRVRKTNEDRAIILMNSDNEVFLAVSDGMGGSEKGDVASKLTIDLLKAAFKKKRKHRYLFSDKNWITRTCKNINKKIYSMAEKMRKAEKKSEKISMGCTLVAVLITGERMMIANIGDSRAYMLKDGELKQLTTDQTYVEYLLKTGRISEEGAKTHPDRHILTNALGVYNSLSLSITDKPYHGESILLCSDGLYNNLDSKEIANILLTDERTDQKVVSLISIANHAGGSDNIGIALWECIAND
ncbi:MAG TPA: Stp1/IreP family PP2C-type Ser/Thr phosphatase [Firmicutes bacterium]|nr:Stp1/IreP family PP2C-type Ser/Thr phosphatase [Bacillota bacterium]